MLQETTTKNYSDIVALQTKPFPHQIEKFDQYYEFLRSHGYLMINHDLGLGKTRTSLHMALTLIAENQANGLLIIVPKSVVSGWVDQIKVHYAGSVECLTWDNTKVNTDKYTQKFVPFIDVNNLKNRTPIFLINIEAFQTNNKILDKWLQIFQETYRTVAILDESSKIKDNQAKRTVRLKNLVTSPYKMTLTGLMAPENPLNVFSQYQFLKKDFWPFKNFFMFRARYAIMKNIYVSGGMTRPVVDGYQNMKELLTKIEPCTWILKKEDCIELPEKIHIPIKIELDKVEQEAYSTFKKELILTLSSGEVITAANKITLFSRFRQITGGFATTKDALLPMPSKLSYLLNDVSETSQSAIIWCEYRHEIELLKEHLSKLGTTVIFSGLQNDEDNNEAKRVFEKGEARFFISDTGKGARGLNLQGFCSLQYFYSLTLSTDEFLQAQDRIHRIGQKETCIYKYLLAEHTVDEHIYALLNKKVSIAALFHSGTIEDVLKIA